MAPNALSKLAVSDRDEVNNSPHHSWLSSVSSRSNPFIMTLMAKVIIRQRSALIQFLLVLLLFLGGGLCGSLLSRYFAPASVAAAFAGFFMMPFSFLMGLQLWLGLAIFHAIWIFLKRLVLKQELFDRSRAVQEMIPSGTFVFLPVSIVVCTTAGALSGIFSDRSGFVLTTLAYLVIGSIYGTAAWQLAKRGYLPFPAEI